MTVEAQKILEAICGERFFLFSFFGGGKRRREWVERSSYALI